MHLLILLSDVRCNRLCRNICAITKWTYLTSVVCTSAGQEDNLCLIPDLILFMPSLPPTALFIHPWSPNVLCGHSHFTVPSASSTTPSASPLFHWSPCNSTQAYSSLQLVSQSHAAHPTLPYHPSYLCPSGHVKFAAMYKLWHVFQYKEGMFTDE